MGCGGCGGGGASGSGGGFPPPGGCTVVPTISCALGGGSPASYLYDPFDDDRGWWNLNTSPAIITGGTLRPSVGFVNRLVPLKLNSANPTGAQVVTLISNIRYRKDNGSTFGGGMVFGDGLWNITIGYRASSGQVVFSVGSGSESSPAPTNQYFETLPSDVNLSIYQHELKAEIEAAELRFYLDGVLKHTVAGTTSLVNANFPVKCRVSNNAMDGSGQFNWSESFAMFGYGLPVDC